MSCSPPDARSPSGPCGIRLAELVLLFFVKTVHQKYYFSSSELTEETYVENDFPELPEKYSPEVGGEAVI